MPELLAAGHEVRVVARHPDRLVDRAWFDQVEIVSGDATDPRVLSSALADVDAAYYLMHSLEGGKDFHNLERRMASQFATAAADAQVGRIVYLGALAPTVPRSELTEHLRSRLEVGETLRGSGVPTV
ncbi:MAG: NAD(P)H-binding protein, partial [Candidatus Nanopelagicales bacterium]